MTHPILQYTSTRYNYETYLKIVSTILYVYFPYFMNNPPATFRGCPAKQTRVKTLYLRQSAIEKSTQETDD